MNRVLSVAFPAAHVRDALRAAVRILALWRRRSRTRAQLAALPPHLLRDIGLDAASAEAEARKGFWRA